MKLVEYSPNTPEENIALDELLLLKAEAGGVGETLRFWEAKDHFVVVGRACKVKEDCFEEKCVQNNLKILRRISGGGTVLQGPGCFNYSAVLSYKSDEGYSSAKTSYKVILGRISDSLKDKGLNVEFYPISDLALDKKKISGNAQARKRSFFLHHGTFIYDLDPDMIPRYLKRPSKEPEYRNSRSHKDFLTNIPLRKEDLKDVIKKAFSCGKEVWEPKNEDLETLNKLARDKYGSLSWNLAF